MSERSSKPALPPNYKTLLEDFKQCIRNARIQASRMVNRVLISLYWELGQRIVEEQEREGWGKAVVERLSHDLRTEFPGTSGFSTQNIWYMRQFYMEYYDAPDLQQLVGEIP